MIVMCMWSSSSLSRLLHSTLILLIKQDFNNLCCSEFFEHIHLLNVSTASFSLTSFKGLNSTLVGEKDENMAVRIEKDNHKYEYICHLILEQS